MSVWTRTGRLLFMGMVVCMVCLTAAAAEPGPASESAAKEQSIYIPYKELRTVLEREGRVVFLPYQEFLTLWTAAREKTGAPTPAGPPVDSIISEMASKATVSKDVVNVSAEIRIEVLKEGWNQISLRLADVAITRAILGQEPARLVFDPKDGYKLLYEKKGAVPQVITLTIDFAKAYTKEPGQNRVSFQTPAAPVSRWDVRVPESGVKVNIHPMLAATDVPTKPEAGETAILAFVGAAPTVTIDWTPKAEGAKGLTAVASVQARQQVTIQEGVTSTRGQLSYAISRAELTRLVVEVPADQKVVNVFDPNVREWSVEKVDDVQRLTIQLFEPAKDTQALVVELEKFSADSLEQMTVPVIKAVEVGRQQGVVVVEVAAGLRAEARTAKGLLQVDASELPADLSNRKWDFSYRYAALPFELTLGIEKIQPRIETDSLVETHLTPEELTIDILTVYDIQRAGVFTLEMDIPAGYEVRPPRGLASGNWAAAEVDTHHLEGADKTHLVVNLKRKAMGKVGLAVQLHKTLREPDLLAPTGKAVELALTVVRMPAATVERQSGRLVVYAPESLRVNPTKSEGLRTVSFKEATTNMVSTVKENLERQVLAFAFTEQPASLTVTAERRKPYVTARQLLVARIDAGVAKYEATLLYDVLYSGVKSFRLDVPADLAGDIRVTTPGIRNPQAGTQEPLADLAPGYVAWNLTGETEFMGTVEIRLAWERKIDKLDIGNAVELTVPRLKPMGADRAWGQIVLAKAETIDIRPTEKLEGLRPIDPQQDLMSGTSVPGAAQAFEFHEDWSLVIAATRYELQEVKRTSIEKALVRMVVTRGNVTSVQALYRMKSQRQRLQVQLPDNVNFDTEPLRINGTVVPLERTEQQKNIYSVPLSAQNADEPFLLELRYTVTGAGNRLEIPAFPEEPAVQKVYLAAYLPEEQAYLGATGRWTDELTWHAHGFGLVPQASHDDGWLLDWVTVGLPVDRSGIESFQTDGRNYLFSTLRPLPSPEGTLHPITVRNDWLKVVVLVLVVGIGAALTGTRLLRRVVAVGCFLVGLVLLGVFLPTLARQVVDGVLFAAVIVVLVVWVVWYFVMTLPRRLRVRRPASPTPARSVEAPSPPPPASGPSGQKNEGGPDHA